MTLTSDLNRPANGHHLILLAPDDAALPSAFRRAAVDRRHYDALLSAMQRMRGSIYLTDGAIHQGQLDSDGRHVVESDRKSWHVLSVDHHGTVVGCSRYLCHSGSVAFEHLGVGQAALAQDPVWGPTFREAIRSEMSLAWRCNLAFAEVGGWAVEKSLRLTTEALRIALSTYALSRWLGGCIGITTATVRHSSASILRKIGGSALKLADTMIPPYFDPQYQCDMEVLRFDSRRPAPRFQSWIDAIFNQIAEAPVVCRTRECMSSAPAFEPALQYRAARAGG